MLRSVRGESYSAAVLRNFGRVMPADAAIQSKIMWRDRARIHEPLRHNLAEMDVVAVHSPWRASKICETEVYGLHHHRSLQLHPSLQAQFTYDQKMPPMVRGGRIKLQAAFSSLREMWEGHLLKKRQKRKRPQEPLYTRERERE